MSKTLFIVNPNAGSGRGRETWRKIEPELASLTADYSVVMTRRIEDVDEIIAQSALNAVERIISIGGDGTINVVVNALMKYQKTQPDKTFIYGTIPAGTGRDFARGSGIPLDTLKAANYVLKQATVRPIDVGHVVFGEEECYFLNISSAGISNDVVQRVESTTKRPWTYLVSVITALWKYEPEAMQIELDGDLWFDGHIYIVAVANGTTFGQGILIAPDAISDDGLFDVVVAEEMPTFDLIRAFPTIYTGKHITHPKVKIGRAKQVRIISPTNRVIGLDFDGEAAASATEIRYEILPAALNILL
ncbi:MAG: diacylglycerol kinase family lipid kinase [Anaerolineae bacterium]|nr:diacylglycerol kinase family lipid kinase [Anaerolineae bacterium]MDQ7033648.1 diacylglycerol kinase family lipid kinase [Anaerolineae bacterium]